jgi:hypothetical protein
MNRRHDDIDRQWLGIATTELWFGDDADSDHLVHKDKRGRIVAVETDQRTTLIRVPKTNMRDGKTVPLSRRPQPRPRRRRETGGRTDITRGSPDDSEPHLAGPASGLLTSDDWDELQWMLWGAL